MSEEIGRGRIVVEVEENVRREMEKAERDFQRTMRNIEREKATVDLDANLKPLQKKVEQAEKKLDEWDKKRSEATLDVDKKKAEAKLKEWEAKLHERREARDSVKLDTKQAQRELIKLQKLEERSAAASERLADKRTSGESKVQKAYQKTVEQANKRATAEEKASDRSALAAEKSAVRAAAAGQRRYEKELRSINRTRFLREQDSQAEEARLQKIRDAAHSLQAEYTALEQRAHKAAQVMNNVFATRDEKIKADVDGGKATARMLAIRAQLAAINKKPIEIPVHLDDTGAQALSRWSKAISTTTVRLGPFTSTIGGAIRAMAILGPAITGVVGALGALVGVVGAAGVGLGGVATAGALGFGAALGGVGLVMRSQFKDYKNLGTLQKAYHTQVLKTGAGSDKAKTKLAEYNHALKEVPPSTRQASKAVGEISNRWTDFSNSLRPQMAKNITSTAQMAGKNFKLFSGETKQSFGIVSRGWQSMMHTLSGPDAKATFKTISDNTQKALPSFGRGLANIGAAIGHAGAAFSRVLPSLGKGFQDWATHLNELTKDPTRMTNFVDKTVAALRSLGHFLQASTRWLGNFFGAGVKPGIGMLDRMTAGLEKMSNAWSTPQGQQSLADGFEKAIGTTEKLYGVLKPLASLFMEWATLMRPFTNFFLQISGTVAKFIDTLAGFGPTKALLTGAFALFLGGTLLGKIVQLGSAAKTVAIAIRSIGTAAAGMKALNFLTGGGAGILGGMFGRGGAKGITNSFDDVARHAAAMEIGATVGGQALANKVAPGAAKAEQALAKTATRSMAAKSAMGLVGASASTMNPLLIAGGIAAAGLGYGLYKLITRETEAEKATKRFNHAIDLQRAAVKQVAPALMTYAQAGLQNSNANVQQSSTARTAAQTQARLDRLRKAGKTHTEAYRVATEENTIAQNNYKQSLLDQYNSQQQLTKAAEAATRARDRDLGTAHQAVNEGQKLVDARRSEIKVMSRIPAQYRGSTDAMLKYINAHRAGFDQGDIDKIKALGDAQFNLKQATNELAAAQNRWTLSGINSQRAMQGLVPMADNAAGAVGRLSKLLGQQKVAKIALKFPDAKQAGNVMKNLDRTISSGVPKQRAFKVVANSKSSEEALRRLNRIKLTPKNVRIIEKGGKETVARLEDIAGRKLTKKELRVAQAGGPKVIALLERIIGKKLPPKQLKLTETGANRIMGQVGRIIGKRIPNKVFTISARDAASSVLAGVRSLANSIHDVSNTVTTHYRTTGSPGKGVRYQGGAVEGYASGADLVERAAARAERKKVERTTGGAYNTPTFLIGEENRKEYVIATNPAYRDQNKQYLSAAANDLGFQLVEAANRGTSPNAKNKTYVGGPTGSYTAHAKGGVPKGHLLPEFSPTLTSDYVPEHNTRATDDLNKLIGEINKARDDYQGGVKKSKSKNKKTKKAGRQEMNAARSRHKALSKQLAGKRKEQREAEADYKKYAKYQSNITRLTTQMNTYAQAYNAYGSPADIKKWRELKEGVGNTWGREDYLAALESLLGQVYRGDGGRGKPPPKYVPGLEEELASVHDQLEGSKLEVPPAAPEKETPTLETWLRDKGKQKALQDLERAYALAQTNNVAEDDAATPGVNEALASLTDDQKAAKDLSDFYSNMLGLAQSSGAPSGVITEAAQAFVGARDVWRGITNDINGTGGGASTPLTYGAQSALVDSEKANALREFGMNARGVSGPVSPGLGFSMGQSVNPANLRPPTVRPSGVSTAQGAPVTNNTVNNNFAQPPPDPHTFIQGIGFEIGSM